MQIGEEHLPFAQLAALLGLRLFHLDDELGLRPGIADLRTRFFVGGVRRADAGAGIRFDDHLMAVRGHLAHGRRRQPDAVFVGLDLLRNTELHMSRTRSGAPRRQAAMSSSAPPKYAR